MIGRSLKTTFHKAFLEIKGSWGSTLPITISKKNLQKNLWSGKGWSFMTPRQCRWQEVKFFCPLFLALPPFVNQLWAVWSLSRGARRAPIPGIPPAPCHPPPISHKVGGRWAQCCRMEGEETSRVEAVKSLTPWPGYWGPVEYIWIMEGAKY